MHTSRFCCFRRCSRIARAGMPQCYRHKKKRLCSFPECGNMANKASRCVRHGARHGCCRALDCHNTHLRVNGFCYAHAKAKVNAANRAVAVAAAHPATTKRVLREAVEKDAFAPLSPWCDVATNDLSVDELDFVQACLNDSDDGNGWASE
ncbi:Aste57867_2464 [Aphanomyces stellatus]|uniref:Aste57867_2464 protein n=1 Tax=Aphanomyces stellatus TaxID=120398 RepID=A0A485KCT5_9STRA|nr:hypothetical protein As57867_002458 [Aphanomyces stellatus]VFT79664.1 Aste57867_2464 [Aphanomyces stellatus]